MRDYAVLFSAVRPQTPFASFLPASVQTPTRSGGRWENQSQSALSPAELPSLESRGTGKPASLSASAARRQLRTRSQLCKRCAALIRRRSSLDSRRRCVLRRENFCDKFLEARLAAQWVEKGVNFNTANVSSGSIPITFFQPVERLLFVAES